MSMLSSFIHKVGDFLNKATSEAPADQQAALSDAANKATTAAQALEAVTPTLAKVIVDAMLNMIPGFGAYIPAFNEFLDILAAEVLARKTVKS